MMTVASARAVAASDRAEPAAFRHGALACAAKRAIDIGGALVLTRARPAGAGDRRAAHPARQWPTRALPTGARRALRAALSRAEVPLDGPRRRAARGAAAGGGVERSVLAAGRARPSRDARGPAPAPSQPRRAAAALARAAGRHEPRGPAATRWPTTPTSQPGRAVAPMCGPASRVYGRCAGEPTCPSSGCSARRQLRRWLVAAWRRSPAAAHRRGRDRCPWRELRR